MFEDGQQISGGKRQGIFIVVVVALAVLFGILGEIMVRSTREAGAKTTPGVSVPR